MTHELDVAHYTRRIITLLDGKIVGDKPNVPSFERDGENALGVSVETPTPAEASS